MMHQRVGGHSRGRGVPPCEFEGHRCGRDRARTSRAIFSEMRPNVIFPFGISPTRSRSTGDASLRCFGGGQMFSYVRTDPHFNVSQS